MYRETKISSLSFSQRPATCIQFHIKILFSNDNVKMASRLLNLIDFCSSLDHWYASHESLTKPEYCIDGRSRKVTVEGHSPNYIDDRMTEEFPNCTNEDF